MRNIQLIFGGLSLVILSLSAPTALATQAQAQPLYRLAEDRLLLNQTQQDCLQPNQTQQDQRQAHTQAQAPDWLRPDLPLEDRVEMILRELSLEEKVAMCHAQGKFSSAGVPRLGIPELWYSDSSHGIRAEINWNDWGYAGWLNDSCTAFPALTCLAATFDPDLAYLYGEAIGQEARYRHKDVLLGPGVNLYRHPLNGRNFEYLGEDPLLASAMVVPYVQGVQENGVAACVKHLVLNNQETDRGHILVKVSERALHELYLPAFKAAAEAGAWSFMGSYNRFLGQHCCHNHYLDSLLRQVWHWDGAIVSDWGGTHNTAEAAYNGLDLEMGTYTDGLVRESAFGYDDYYLAKPYREGLRSGEYPMETLDSKVRNILRLMLRTNLNPYRPLGSMTTEAHAEVARKIAAEGIVLLKNEGGLLPLQDLNNPQDTNDTNDTEDKTGKETNTQTIAVIGENATRNLMEGGGSSELKPRRVITPLQGIQEAFPHSRVLYARAYDSGKPHYDREGTPTHDAETLRREALETAAQADVVIFVGGLNKNHRQDCEGADRQSYELPFGQPQLIRDLARINPRIVVVLLSGNAVETSWAADVPALLQAWYLGSEGGHALADVLSGRVNPSGKLPFSFPVRLEDNGAMCYGPESYPGNGEEQTYKEDLLVGYRWHESLKIPAAWPFGFGLSYTRFSLEKARLDNARLEKASSEKARLEPNTAASARQTPVYRPGDTIRVSVEVRNTGNREGAEVVQLYVAKPRSRIARPVKELKAFHKLRLESGQAGTARLDVPVKSLAYYDENAGDWTMEPGDYLLYIATDSRKTTSTLKIRVEL